MDQFCGLLYPVLYGPNSCYMVYPAIPEGKE